MWSSARAWPVWEVHILRGDGVQEWEVIARLLVLVPRAVSGPSGLWKSEDLQ